MISREVGLFYDTWAACTDCKFAEECQSNKRIPKLSIKFGDEIITCDDYEKKGD